MNDGSASLLRHPSKAMERLLKSSDPFEANGGGDGGAIKRPVLAFSAQKHDLTSLQMALRQALRKATCRVHALQAFNWLLRSVTQSACLHDLMWFFTACLTQRQQEAVDDDEDEEKDGAAKPNKKDVEQVRVCRQA